MSAQSFSSSNPSSPDDDSASSRPSSPDPSRDLAQNRLRDLAQDPFYTPGPMTPHVPVVGMDMITWVHRLANKLRLDEANIGEIFAFLEVEIFKMAQGYRTLQAIERNHAEYEAIKRLVERMENMLDQSVVFTDMQKNVVRMACRVVVYEDTQTDYSNIAISEAVLEKIKKHSKNNGFKDFFEHGAPTQARSDALRTLIGKEASYIKGQFKGVFKTALLGSPPTSLSQTLMECTTKFKQSMDIPDVGHALHILIIRSFSRSNLHLFRLDDTGIEPDSDSPSSNRENMPPPAKKAKKRKATGTAAKGTDFFSKLTQFFIEKERIWGTNISTGGWAAYVSLAFGVGSEADNLRSFVNDAIRIEEREHPDDPMPLIPRSSAAPVLGHLNNTIDSMHLEGSSTGLNTVGGLGNSGAFVQANLVQPTIGFNNSQAFSIPSNAGRGSGGAQAGFSGIQANVGGMGAGYMSSWLNG
ncbi:hypothetical protein H0H92_004303 [Tricholoma furcatifolium]|nr:hypothetical protein H0H92_004303 [Tricholoma furcatifolium]